jgi:hypothetical protein
MLYGIKEIYEITSVKMKKVRIIILLSLSVLNTNLFAQLPATTVDFFNMIDLTRSDMKVVASLVSQSKYDAALQVWRDTAVNRLRRMDMGQFSWHANCLNGYYINWAKLIVGNINSATYQAGATSYNDYYGITNSPYNQPVNINWMALPPSGMKNNDGDISDYMLFIPLAATYYQTADTIYLKKWFQSSNDFSLRQKSLLFALSSANQTLHSPRWTLGSQEVLWQGDRIANIIKCLGVFAKNLPGETAISNWTNIINTSRGNGNLKGLSVIPAKELSNIAAALVIDNPSIMLSAYRYAGKAPNQRFNGLYSLMMLCFAFPEFKAITPVDTATVAGLTDYISTMAYPDGGFLEQSFNYNQSDIAKMQGLLGMATTVGRANMPVMVTISNASDNFNRMLWAIKTPLMAPPLAGNGAHSGAPSVWASTAIANNYKSTISASSDLLSQQIVNAFNGSSSSVPGFTSISFPYSGYYTQRKGWKIDDPYLYFMSGRPARGHKMGDNNGIQVVAFGRELLSTDGPPDYFGKLPSDVSGYVSEFSSLKANTVIVDGKSQNKNNILMSIASNPIGTRHYNSITEDFLEGTFSDGYCDIGATTASITDVTHSRQTLFLKEAGIWIITDFLNSPVTSSHTYSQVWNFEPYDPTSQIYGFTDTMVTFDKTTKRILTSDPSGPNIRLQHFGQVANLNYVKYYGQNNPAMGWYAPSISVAIPAADVHANWTGTGNQTLGTIIMPAKGLTTDIVYKDVSPDINTVAASINLVNGNKVLFSSGIASKSATQFNFTFNSKGYLLQQSANGDVSGCIIGGDKKPLIWNGNSIVHGFSDYGVNYSAATQTITLTPFEVANTFAWNAIPLASIELPKQAKVVWKAVITNVNNYEKHPSVLFPNPSNNEFFLNDVEGVQKIRIFTIQGIEVSQIIQFDQAFGKELNSGMYVVKIEYADGNSVYRKIEKIY